MTTRTLSFQAHSFDQTTSFEVVTDSRVVKALLQCDYNKVGDGILWALNTGSCIKSGYSGEDIKEIDRLANETPLRHGDDVVIGGAVYTVRVLGPFSDCAIFDLKVSE